VFTVVVPQQPYIIPQTKGKMSKKNNNEMKMGENRLGKMSYESKNVK